MGFKDILGKVQESEEFKSWRSDNPDNVLAHIFIMYDGDKLMDQQVGYYNKSRGTMSSFTISSGSVTLIPEAEVLKRPDGGDIKELDLSQVKVDFEEAEEKSDRLAKDKYSKSGSKKIYILQNIDEGLVWNITLLTNDYNTLNIRIDAASGEILKDEIVNIIDFHNSK